jgi:hypothetical protein
MRRRRLLLGIGVAAVLGAGLLVASAPSLPATGVTLENYHRLRAGMTRREVKSILGEPSRLAVACPSMGELPPIKGVLWKVNDFQANEVEIVLLFDRTGRLEWGRGNLQPLQAADGLLDRLRRLLPW